LAVKVRANVMVSAVAEAAVAAYVANVESF
jgi:hypothetical protein